MLHNLATDLEYHTRFFIVNIVCIVLFFALPFKNFSQLFPIYVVALSV